MSCHPPDAGIPTLLDEWVDEAIVIPAGAGTLWHSVLIAFFHFLIPANAGIQN